KRPEGGNPAADAYVDASLPGSNFGRSTALRTDAYPVVTTYLRFTPAGVGATHDQVLGGRYERARNRTAVSLSVAIPIGTTSAWIVNHGWWCGNGWEGRRARPGGRASDPA